LTAQARCGQHLRHDVALVPEAAPAREAATAARAALALLGAVAGHRAGLAVRRGGGALNAPAVRCALPHRADTGRHIRVTRCDHHGASLARGFGHDTRAAPLRNDLYVTQWVRGDYRAELERRRRRHTLGQDDGGTDGRNCGCLTAGRLPVSGGHNAGPPDVPLFAPTDYRRARADLWRGGGALFYSTVANDSTAAPDQCVMT